MKKYLNHILALIIALSGLSSCSDKDEPSPIPEEPEVNGYCLMMYISGGDKEHDLIFAESIRQATDATGDDVSATVLFKASGKAEGEEHNGIRRYTAQDGVMTEDGTFTPGDDFAIYSPGELTEFIRWSAEKYPNRHYILVIGGGGGPGGPPLPASRFLADEPTMEAKETLAVEQKRSIAQAAAKLINADDFVFIDAGSTTLELVRALAEDALKASYVTNGVAHARALARKGWCICPEDCCGPRPRPLWVHPQSPACSATILPRRSWVPTVWRWMPVLPRRTPRKLP